MRVSTAARRGAHVALGLDFGTESCRAVLVGLDGAELGTASCPYMHGQITQAQKRNDLPFASEALPKQWALQHPMDWLNAASRSIAALDIPGHQHEVVSVGVDFTACTMLPVSGDNTPLCLQPQWEAQRHAWPKLWKHHGAARQAQELTMAAQAQSEPWLARYGGNVGLEWMFPKMLEVYDDAIEVSEAAAAWVEAGDWLVAQLCNHSAATMTRSTCQAGYKALWGAEGLPSEGYLDSVRAGFGSHALARLTTSEYVAPGRAAGTFAARKGLLECDAGGFAAIPDGVEVSAAAIDAHAGVPGVGAGGAGQMVLVMGTSNCYMLNAATEVEVPGIAGVVPDGILPGLVGYEAGQAAVGDAFAWLSNCVGRPLEELERDAERIPAGANGVLCVDHFHGCRTPLMDASRRAQLHGIGLGTTPPVLYRAIAEGTAMGCRRVMDLIESSGAAHAAKTGVAPADSLHIAEYIATGGLAHRPMYMKVVANVLGRPILVSPSVQGPATGAAIFGALAASKFKSATEAVEAMSKPIPPEAVVEPDVSLEGVYKELYESYMAHAHMTAAEESLS